MARKEALKKYERAKLEGKVDKDIIPLLDLINSTEFYTTSSCSGRISILSVPKIGDKQNANFLGKWHSTIKTEDVIDALSCSWEGYAFLLMQSPIIHVVAPSLSKAMEFIKIALGCGFKYSAIKNVGDNSTLLEVLSTENLSVPLGKNGEIIADYKTIKFSVEISNILLKRAKSKLKCLEEEFSCSPLSFS